MRFVYERITERIAAATQTAMADNRKLDSVFLTDNEWHQFKCEIMETGIGVDVYDGCKYMGATVRRENPCGLGWAGEWSTRMKKEGLL